MDVATSILPASFQAMPYATPAAVGGLAVSLFFAKKLMTSQNKNTSGLPPVPEVPGWPVIGNLLQLKEKKPHKTFLRWAETYGPIYSIRTGASTVIVLNSTEVAKEAMVARYSSISTRKLTKSLNILTQNKSMVAVSDYDDFHKMVKRHILTSVLGPNAQKRHRHHREVMMENLSTRFHSHADKFPGQDCNFREIFESELFAISMKEALGNDIETLYVDDLGKTLSREEVFHVLVLDPMEGAIEVDWRDFFPYLKWVPNSGWEARINRMYTRREAVMKALIKQEKKRIASGEQLNCFLDYLLEEGKNLNDRQVSMLIWETIIETSDTTMVTTEWAMYELSKNPACQERLFEEIKRVCGSEKVTEDRLSQLPYLTAVFHETIRKYSPAPVIPLRYVHEDTQLGGYNVPAGSQIAVNIYGCNHDKNQWEDPEEWKPERFLDGRFDPMELHKTMAFGAGKRACAGALQAMLIACSAIGRMVQEFEWRLKQGEVANVDTLGLTTRKLEPLYVVMKPRKQ